MSGSVECHISGAKMLGWAGESGSQDRVQAVDGLAASRTIRPPSHEGAAGTSWPRKVLTMPGRILISG